MEETGTVKPYTQQIVLSASSAQSITIDNNQYKTNNNFLGYIANIASFQLNYYTPDPQTFISYFPQYDQSLNCFSITDFSGNTCLQVQFISSGNTNIVTQNFDDITAPLLFFLSISQTMFYICYLLFLRNYSNNALNLRIADSVVYIPDSYGKHYNFKSGIACFLACLIYKHPFIKVLDNLLYRLRQTNIKKLLSVRCQLAMDMIKYGE